MSLYSKLWNILWNDPKKMEIRLRDKVDIEEHTLDEMKAYLATLPEFSDEYFKFNIKVSTQKIKLMRLQKELDDYIKATKNE